MSLRCVIIFTLIFAARSALIKRNSIPVEIVYDKTNPVQYGNRNLDAKIQLSPDDFLKLRLSDEIINEGPGPVEVQVDDGIPHGNPYGVRNLDEKIQLSPEELGVATKFLPVVENDENEKAEILQESATPVPELNQEESNDLKSLLKKAEEVVYSGVNAIRSNIDKATDAVANAKPTPEAWQQFNQTLEKFFTDQYKSVSLKADGTEPSSENNQNNNQNNQGNEFIQVLINGFQSIAQNFAGNNFGQGQKPGGPEDEQVQQGQQPNPFQSLINMFAGGINQVVNNMNNINGQNNQNGTTGQEDTGGISNGGTDFFGNVVTQIQQFFQGNNQGNNPSQSVHGNQSDTGTQPAQGGGNPGDFFQGAINQFNQVINNFRPPGQPANPPKPVEGDEGVPTSSTTQSSGIFQGFQQAFQNVIKPPQLPQGGSGGSGGSGGPPNPIETIQNQIGQFGGGGSSGGSGGPPNPIESIQNQIGQFGGGGGSGGSGGPPNPLETIQNQIGQLGGGSGGSGGPPNPLESIQNQIGQVGGGGGGNFVENLQNAVSGGSSSSTEKSKADTSPQKEEDVSPAPAESQKQSPEPEKNA